MNQPQVRLVVAGALALMVIPASARDQSSSSGESPIVVLRWIGSAEESFASNCARGGYAITLADLAKPPRGSKLAFIRPELSRNGIVRNGYIYEVAKDARSGVVGMGDPALTCNESTMEPASSYYASATPTNPGGGRPFYATDSRGIIYYSATGPVPNPIPPGASVVE